MPVFLPCNGQLSALLCSAQFIAFAFFPVPRSKASSGTTERGRLGGKRSRTELSWAELAGHDLTWHDRTTPRIPLPSPCYLPFHHSLQPPSSPFHRTKPREATDTPTASSGHARLPGESELVKRSQARRLTNPPQISSDGPAMFHRV